MDVAKSLQPRLCTFRSPGQFFGISIGMAWVPWPQQWYYGCAIASGGLIESGR